MGDDIGVCTDYFIWPLLLHVFLPIPYPTTFHSFLFLIFKVDT